MKNERLKGFVVGLIVATIITSAGFAAAGGKSIEVFYDAVKDIKINQVSKMPKGDMAPFVYKGTTFIPLRFVSENLGQTVKWDGNTKTVYIGQMPDETAVYVGDGIKYMNHQQNSGFFEEKFGLEAPIKDNIGNDYANYCILNIFSRDAWNYVEYPTNGQFKRFKATLGLTDRYKSTENAVTFEIFADDKLVYSKTMEAGTMPEDIDVDIKNAIKVKMKITGNGIHNSDISVGLFNPRFVK